MDSAVQEREWEASLLEEIELCLQGMDNLQQAWLGHLAEGDLEAADGRKCILGISGLQYHRYEKFFQVTSQGVRLVDPYEDFNTYITASLPAVVRVLKGVLSGDPTAFASEWSRGQCKLVGSRYVHDGLVFSQVFSRLALLIRKIRQAQAAT